MEMSVSVVPFASCEDDGAGRDRKTMRGRQPVSCRVVSCRVSCRAEAGPCVSAGHSPGAACHDPGRRLTFGARRGRFPVPALKTGTTTLGCRRQRDQIAEIRIYRQQLADNLTGVKLAGSWQPKCGGIPTK